MRFVFQGYRLELRYRQKEETHQKNENQTLEGQNCTKLRPKALGKAGGHHQALPATAQATGSRASPPKLDSLYFS